MSVPRLTQIFSIEVDGATLSGRERTAEISAADRSPLIIALHGGTYSSAYFDIDSFSLLDRASRLGFNIIALDRPGYGRSTRLPAGEATIVNNAARLDEAIAKIWARRRGSACGVIIIGHSIGAAIATAIAARQPAWPLLGIAISGVGLAPPPQAGEAWAALPDLEMIDLPPEMKDAVMFGPEHTYLVEAPEHLHRADAPVPRAELIDIVTGWPESARAIAAAVRVPVHYRQGEFDRLWVTDHAQVLTFGAAFTTSGDVDARLYRSVGHCIDFHELGPAFHLEQLAFVMRCAAGRQRP